MDDNNDRWIKFEFAALVMLALLALWQIAEFVWRSLAGFF